MGSLNSTMWRMSACLHYMPVSRRDILTAAFDLRPSKIRLGLTIDKRNPQPKTRASGPGAPGCFVGACLLSACCLPSCFLPCLVLCICGPVECRMSELELEEARDRKK